VSMRGRTMLAVDDLHVGKPRHLAVIESRTRERGSAAAIEWLRIRKIDRSILRKVAVENHIEEAALGDGSNFWHDCKRGRQLAITPNDTHASRSLRHQHATVGQKCDRPGMH